MKIGILTRHGISFTEKLDTAFLEINGKSYRDIETIVGCSRSAAFSVCKKLFKSRTVKNLPRIGRPGKFAKIFLSFRASDASP